MTRILLDGAAVYFLTMVVAGIFGLVQGFQFDTSHPKFLLVRKSKMTRLAMGMLSLMCLGGLPLIVSAAQPADLEVVSWLIVPGGIGLFTLFGFLAGPQDVRIDLDTRLCCETKGWFFLSKRRTYPLTDASSVCAHCGNKSCCAILRVGDAANTRFVLAMCGSESAALSFAQVIGKRLHLTANVVDNLDL